jgi:hypothetical protein
MLCSKTKHLSFFRLYTFVNIKAQPAKPTNFVQTSNATDATQQQSMVNGDIVTNPAQQASQQTPVSTQSQQQPNITNYDDVS